jgi:uncharacterized protein (TIGR03435 family)
MMIVAKATVVLVVALLALRWTRPATASVRHLLLAAAFAVLAVLPLVERFAPPVGIPVDGFITARVVLPITRVEFADAGNAAPATSSIPSRPTPAGAALWSRNQLLLVVWGVGAGICLVPVLLTPWRLRQLRGKARRWSRGDALLREIAPSAAHRVAVFLHDDETAPLMCGIARPVILMPAGATGWSDVDVERALAHELEHVRRADWPVYLTTRILCALYWFHPLVWIAWRRLGLEAERACDDAVLRVAEAPAYAQQLVTLARQRWRTSSMPVLSMAGHSDLSTRVAALLDETQARGRLGRTRASVIVAAAAMLIAALGPLRVQAEQIVVAKADAAAFDVVSIRENKSGDSAQSRRRQPGGRIIVSNFPLRALIIDAFGLQTQQLSDGPDWIDSARWDITAQASGEFAVTEPGTVGPVQLMMQRMLIDRFRLAVHTEKRELPIYLLTVARRDGRLGPGLKPAAIDCESLMNEMMKRVQGGGAPSAPPERPGGGPGCGMRSGPGPRISAGGTSMGALARMLAGPMGRIVEDRTKLTGGYDFDLEFDPSALAGFAPGGPPAAENAASIFTALEEQLGLKLQSERAPVEVLVIDRVERPSEN